MSCHSLLQGIIPTQGSNLGLLHCWQILYCLSNLGNCVLCIFATVLKNKKEMKQFLTAFAHNIRDPKLKHPQKERKKVKLFSRVRLCDPMDCSPTGSSVHGIFQARIEQWVAISFSRGSSQPMDRTQVSHTAGRRFTLWASREAQASVGPGKLCKWMSEPWDSLEAHRPGVGNGSPAQPGLTMQEGGVVCQEEWKFWIFRWNLWTLQIGN